MKVLTTSSRLFVNVAKLTIIKIILIYPRTSGHATLMIKGWSNWIPIVNGRSVVIIGDYIHFPNRTNCVESLKLQIWFTPTTEWIWLIPLIYATGVNYYNTYTFICCWYYHYENQKISYSDNFFRSMLDQKIIISKTKEISIELIKFCWI